MPTNRAEQLHRNAYLYDRDSEGPQQFAVV
jgi:hypothetical protein